MVGTHLPDSRASKCFFYSVLSFVYDLMHYWCAKVLVWSTLPCSYVWIFGTVLGSCGVFGTWGLVGGHGSLGSGLEYYTHLWFLSALLLPGRLQRRSLYQWSYYHASMPWWAEILWNYVSKQILSLLLLMSGTFFSSMIQKVTNTESKSKNIFR